MAVAAWFLAAVFLAAAVDAVEVPVFLAAVREDLTIVVPEEATEDTVSVLPLRSV